MKSTFYGILEGIVVIVACIIVSIMFKEHVLDNLDKATSNQQAFANNTKLDSNNIALEKGLLDLSKAQRYFSQNILDQEVL